MNPVPVEVAAGLGCFALARWIDRREQLGINGRARLFCTLEGQPVSAPYVRMALARLAKRAGIDRRVNPHAFRHSFAAEMAREGQPMNLIQQALGHSSLGTTSRYLAHINPQEVVDAMRQRLDAFHADTGAPVPIPNPNYNGSSYDAAESTVDNYLADAGLAWMGDRGIRRAEIQVAAENAGARDFWRALGFTAAMDVLERRF